MPLYLGKKLISDVSSHVLIGEQGGNSNTVETCTITGGDMYAMESYYTDGISLKTDPTPFYYGTSVTVAKNSFVYIKKETKNPIKVVSGNANVFILDRDLYSANEGFQFLIFVQGDCVIAE